MAKKAKKPQDRVNELLDSLLEGKQPAEILGEEGLLAELTKRLVETCAGGRDDLAPRLLQARAGGA
jgi:hypothetical protein